MRTTSISLLVVVLLVACIGSPDCRGGSIRHDRPAAKYRELGQASAFQSVGEVARPPSPGSNWSPSGSAVLIAPEWALTAGHVAADRDWEKHRYRFGGEEYRVVRSVAYPAPSVKPAGLDARLAGIAAGADLALVKLDRPVQNVRPAARYRAGDEVGKTMTKVGYGCIGDGLAGMTDPPTQERRGGNNVIDAAGGKLGELTVSERVLLCDFDHPDDATLNRLGAPTPLELEIGMSVGDSGGGWFIQDGGSWKLVAITSSHLPPKGDPRDRREPDYYGSVMAGMRVSTANDWIDGVIGASAATGDTEGRRQTSLPRKPTPEH